MHDDAIHRLNATHDGRYRVEREVGEGGTAAVYLADDVRHEHALKVLKLEPTAVDGKDR